MPNQVIYASLILAALLIVTILLLVQPRFIWEIKSVRGRGVAGAMGVAFLCATFVWSFILGSLLVIHDMPIPYLIFNR